jgi:uncharacterized protein
MNMRILLAATLLLPAALSAQEPPRLATDTTVPPSLALLVQREGGTVVLRWAPGNPGTWLHGNAAGYRVERAPYRLGTAPAEVVGFESLSPAPLRPWTQAEWRAGLQSENRWAAIAIQMLSEEIPVESGQGPLREIRDRGRLLENRHGFALFAADMDSVAASGLGLRLADRVPDPNADYVYRVFLDTPPEGAGIDTAYAFAPSGDVAPAPPPEGVRPLVGDSEIGLVWLQGLPGRAYTGFHIDRSEDAGGSWQRLTPTPLVQLETITDSVEAPRFRDSNVVNGRTYRYRVQGITPFATLSAPAEVEATPRDLTPPPAPVLDAVEPVGESAFHLRWSAQMVPDLAGFRVGVSPDPEGPFQVDERVLPPSAREVTDTRAVAGAHNHYVIIAVDTAGNAAPSLARYALRPDSTPPAPPSGLVARADSAGRVTIRWALGPEPDIAAYRVFRKRQDDHEPVLQTGQPLADTVYVDSLDLRTLSREAFYEVVALDHHFNASAPSRVRVVLPDAVPPVAPVIREITPTTRSVELAWIPSSSEDVARQRVVRRRSGGRDWGELAVLDARAERFTDTLVVRGTTYEYSIIAEDSAGLRSEPAEPMAARPFDSGLRAGVTGLRAAVDAGVVRLTWNLPADAGERWLVVYRATGNEELAVHRTIPVGDRFEEAVPPDSYRYAIQVFHRDGGRSAISEPVGVIVQ